MNLVIHYLKKDLRYLRLLVNLWFALLLVNSLLLRSGLDRFITIEEGIEVLASAYVLLYVLQQILQIVIVCQLVQTDALAGTTAFWLTRPISRKELLLSKLSFVLLILVLPSLLAEVIVFWANGIPVSLMLSALREEVILQTALFLVPSMLVAVLTPNLSRLVVTGLASVTAFFLIHYAVLASVMAFSTSSKNQAVLFFPGQWPRIFPTGPSAMLVSALLTIALGAMVIVYQYLKRKTFNSATGSILGMCLVIATLNFLPVDSRAFSRSLPASSGLNPENVKLVIQRETKAGFVTNESGRFGIFGRFELDGVPPNFFLWFTRFRATLGLPNGKVVSSDFDNPVFSFLNFFPTEKDLKVLNDPVNDPWPGYGPPILPLLSVDAGTFQSYKDTPGTYMADASLDAFQRLTSTLPLEVGAKVKGDTGETMILNIVPHESMLPSPDPRSDGFVLLLRESGVRQWLRRTSLTGPSYMLRNQSRKEVILGRSHPKDIFGRFPALHRLLVNRGLIYFTTGGIPNYQGPAINEEWLRGAELVRFENCFIGQFSKSVRVDNFEMDPKKSP